MNAFVAPAPPARLPAWFAGLTRCPECTGGPLAATEGGFACGACGAAYPVVNRTPLLLPPSALTDAAAAIAAQIGHADAEAVARALGTALRYRLHDPGLRGEFTNVVERYLPSDRPPAAGGAPEDPGETPLRLVAQYFNPRFEAAGTAYRSLRVRNESGVALQSAGTNPFYLSYWITDAAGRRADGPRSPFPIPLAPGRELSVPLRIDAPARPGRYRFEAQLVHEHVRWFDRNVLFSAEIEVGPGDRDHDRIVRPPHGGYFDVHQDMDQAGAVLRRAIDDVLGAGRAEAVVLELGGGHDPIALRYPHPRARVVATDLSFPQAQLGQLRHGRGDADRFAFAAADVHRMPFAPGAFDVVVVCAALHHFPDIVAALDAMRALLAPGGAIVLLREPGKVVPLDPAYVFDLARGYNEQQFELAEYAVMYRRAGLAIAYAQMDFECSYKAILRPA